jgi:hypothetical protein
MTQNTHTPGPFYLVRYTNVNECRITAVMSKDEYEAQDDPADFYNVKILCNDMPPEYAAAPELLEGCEWLEAYAKVQIKYHPDSDDTPNWQKLVAAIAKARGRA